MELWCAWCDTHHEGTEAELTAILLACLIASIASQSRGERKPPDRIGDPILKR